MNICKKCGERAKPNTYKAGYYCYNCGNLGYDDVYSAKEISEKLNKIDKFFNNLSIEEFEKILEDNGLKDKDTEITYNVRHKKNKTKEDELLLKYRRILAIISEILITESKQEISNESAIEDIRKIMREI